MRRIVLIACMIVVAIASAHAQRPIDDIYYNRTDARCEAEHPRVKEKWKNGARQIIFIDDTTGTERHDTIRCVIRNTDGSILISRDEPAPHMQAIRPVACPAWPLLAYDIAWTLWDIVPWFLW